MSKKYKFLFALSLLIIFISSLTAFVRGRGIMGDGMGEMMDDMTLMNMWLSGETLPIDLKAPRPKENEISINTGKIIYETRCVFCHGLKGDGKGENASKLQTKPRDFTFGVYKFRSTPTGGLPTDDDIFKTISRGLHGTAMLPWLGLTTDQKWSVAYYIKTFSDAFEDDEKSEIVKIPKANKSSMDYIKQGKMIYQKSECLVCHGFEGYGDGTNADQLKDDWQQPIRPTNFRQQLLKRGLEIEDIYLTIATGLNGTPMPSFSDSLTQDEIMALAYYIQSIAPQRSADMGMMLRQDVLPDEQAGMMIDHVMMPSNLEDLKTKETGSRGRLGVLIQKITPELAKLFNISESKGALVADVLKGSPAERDGIKRGDVIVEFDGQPAKGIEELPKIVARTEPGSEVDVVVIRDGIRKVIKTTIDQPEDTVVTAPNNIEKIGIRVEAITSELMQSLDLDSRNGVLVANVIFDSPAGAAGILRGDVILEINREKINNLNDFQEKMDKTDTKDTVLFLIKRSGSTLFIAVNKELKK